jgi:hypothetical protein
VRAFLSLGQGEPLPRSGIAREINLLSCASCLSSRTNSRALGNFFGQINPFLPARRRATVDHSLVAGDAQRQGAPDVPAGWPFEFLTIPATPSWIALMM